MVHRLAWQNKGDVNYLDLLHKKKVNNIARWLIATRVRDLLKVDWSGFTLFIDKHNHESLHYKSTTTLKCAEFSWLMKYFLWGCYDADSFV